MSSSRDHAQSTTDGQGNPTLADIMAREEERLSRLALDIEAHQAIVDHFRPRYEAMFEPDSPTAADKMTLYPHVITHEHTIRDWRRELEDRRALLDALSRAECGQ